MTSTKSVQSSDNKVSSKQFKRAVKSKHGGIFSGGNATLGLIAGRTCAGKTQLLFHMLTTPKVLDYNRLYIYTPTTSQSAYQFLLYGFNKNLTKEAVNYLFYKYEEDESIEMSIEDFCNEASKNAGMSCNVASKIEVTLDSNSLPLPEQLDKTKRNLIIFDDCVSSRNQILQKEYFTRGRHNSCTVFYLTQRYYDVEKIIRDNVNIIILFKQPHRSLTALLNNLDYDNAHLFKIQALSEWKKDYGYVAINTEKNDDGKLTNDIFDFLDEEEEV